MPHKNIQFWASQAPHFISYSFPSVSISKKSLCLSIGDWKNHVRYEEGEGDREYLNAFMQTVWIFHWNIVWEQYGATDLQITHLRRTHNQESCISYLSMYQWPKQAQSGINIESDNLCSMFIMLFVFFWACVCDRNQQCNDMDAVLFCAFVIMGDISWHPIT